MDPADLFAPVTPRASSPSQPEDTSNTNMAPSPDDARPVLRPEEMTGNGTATATGGDDSARSETSQEVAVASAKGKAKEKKAPLRLLDLPVDVLKEIIHQLPHTNDLTSLALCHSALHRLAIPYIYSRFDIVWPDETNHPDTGKGVDALTFGLATLVMGWDTFPHQARRGSPVGTGTPRIQPDQSDDPAALYPLPRMRFGNYYAQYTKKFSLGNGPPMWVQEYIISKESGKMLGTLVAMAVARMINLETFIWDMPTGVLGDVWRALSSLAYRTDGQECRLERLWVRWHDNTIDSPAPPPAPPLIVNNLPPPPNTTHPSGVGTLQMAVPITSPSSTASAVDRVEHPTFSVIPALKSLSVLDIDELPYLDEMSILIARSQRKLRELRVGIAIHALDRVWTTAWEGPGIQQVDYSTTSTAASSISEKRLGGVLGILVGRVHNMRHSEQQLADPRNAAAELAPTPSPAPVKSGPAPKVSAPQDAQQDRDSDSMDDSVASASDEPLETGHGLRQEPEQNLREQQDNIPSRPSGQSGQGELNNLRTTSSNSAQRLLTGKLSLEVLELERVPLSVSVLLKAINWSILTTLTLLNCDNHEQLWKALRREYTPRSAIPNGPASSTTAYKASYTLRHRTEYRLNIKKIHTNTVSPSLISFIKDALAPNTLEVLFLQEGRSYSGAVSVDAIYRGPLKRHRASLKKLMIDSSEKGPDGQPTNSLRWRRWVLNREIISFITSGRMTGLRELAFSIDYKDWHHFLQRLPQIPHLRSLYIPFIADHVHGNNLDPRELAMQVLDIVHLRPEIQLCYMGITHKCFEILENKPSASELRHDGMHDGPYAAHDQLSSDDDESEVTEDDIEDEDFGDMPDAGGAGEETASEASEEGHHEESDDDSFLQDERKGPRLRIREILFYEEKIETLRARHGILKP